MYLVKVELVVRGKIERQIQFECSNIKKDIIESKIQQLTSVKIDKFDLLYLDDQNGSIQLSSEYSYAKVQSFPSYQRNIIKIIAMTDELIQLKKSSKKMSQREMACLFQKKQEKLEQLCKQKGKDKKQNKKGQFQNKIQRVEYGQQQKLPNEIVRQELDYIYPNISKKQRKRLKKKLQRKTMINDLRILKTINQENPIKIQKKQQPQKLPQYQPQQQLHQNPAYIGFEQGEDEQCNNQLQEMGVLENVPFEKGYRQLLNYISKLKRNIKQQILAQLPQYLKKQCFKVVPFQISKIAEEPLCFSCEKNLESIPLPIYVNNKNQFYCSDCESCRPEDDELLVKIKSESLRKEIFMVKCVPVFKDQIKHIQSMNFSSTQQKYQEILKFAKGIAIHKLRHSIFKQEERTIMHNRLIKSQQRKNAFYENQKRKMAKLQHKMRKEQMCIAKVFKNMK